MNSLYKRVIKGVYEEPPAVYSRDIKKLINSMLVVKSESRPSCEQILNSKEFQAAVKRYSLDESVFHEFLQTQQISARPENESKGHKQELLKTILLPKNLKSLSKKLPKATYE